MPGRVSGTSSPSSSPEPFASPSPSVSYTEVHIKQQTVNVPLTVPVTDAVRFEVNDYGTEHLIGVRSPSGQEFRPDPGSGVVYNQQIVFVTAPEAGVWTLTMDASSTPRLVRVAAIPVNIPQNPVAVLSASDAGSLTVTFDASDSYDPDGTVVTYEWSFGDGEYGQGVAPTHTYRSPGTYLVTLIAKDNEGLLGFASSNETVG